MGREYTDEELLGTPGDGRCMDCKWYENSAVAKACGCRFQPGFHLLYDRAEHIRVLALARVAQKRARACTEV